MDYLIIFFIFIIFVVLIIFGLPYSKSSFNYQIAKEQAEQIRENFEVSSQEDVKKGASTFHDWAIVATISDGEEKSCDITSEELFPGPKQDKKKEGQKERCSGKDCLGPTPEFIENDYYIYPKTVEKTIREKADCSQCDATRCANIDAYVLKTSVPPCPDMSNFAPKSMIKPCPDMSDYIKKSEIPPCPTCPDMRDYVRKSSVPACAPPVVCPKCPVCPDCPPCPPCPKVYKQIQDDPRFQTWLNKYENEVDKKIDKFFISRKKCDNDKNDSYQKGKKDGMNEAYREIAQIAGRYLPKDFQDKINKKKEQQKKTQSEIENNKKQNQQSRQEQEREERRKFNEERRQSQPGGPSKQKESYESETQKQQQKKQPQKISQTQLDKSFQNPIRPTPEQQRQMEKSRGGNNVTLSQHNNVQEDEMQQGPSWANQFASPGMPEEEYGPDCRLTGCPYRGYSFPMGNNLYTTQPVC